MKPANIALAALFLLLTAFRPAFADDGNRVVASAGYFDIFDQDKTALDLRLDYHWGTPLLWQIKPFVGLEGNTDGSAYGLGGLYADWGFSPHWYLTPSIGAGLYFHGSGKDLGDTVEFRTQLDVSYEFENSQRVGVGISHISNFGLDNSNPGTEVLNLSYSIPMNIF